MKVKEYLVMFVILFMTLSSLAMINISVKPAQAAPLRNLTVQSTPFVGIDFTINGTSYTTNTTVSLEQGFYTVSIPSTWMNGSDQYTFMRWEDDSTNPVRIVSLTSAKTIIAFYRHVKVYVNQSLGYIPGQPQGQKVTVDIIIEVSNIPDNSAQGIVGWGMDIQVDPDVLNISRAKGATNGYFLYDFVDYGWTTFTYFYDYPTLLQGDKDSTTGLWDELSEIIMPVPLGGAGEGYSGLKLITLEFTSKSETAYSKIDLFNITYLTPDNKWHPVDEVIDGEYNQPVYHNLTVGSTPIVGINFTIHTPTYATNMSDTTNTSVILLEKNYTVTMPSTWMNNTDQYNFEKWEDNSTNRQRTINLTSNTTITATYELVTENYTLTVNSIPISGVNFTIGSSTYTTNASVILMEGPHTVSMPWMNGTYIFRRWEDNSTNRVRTIDLVSNTTITATYGLAENYTLTVNSIPISGVNFTIGSSTYTTNASVSLMEGPHTVSMPSVWMVGADQYNFVEWEDNSTNRQRAISLTSNTTINATYKLPYIKVYVNQSLGYIPGQPQGQKVTVDIIIEVSGIPDDSVQGIVGWGLNVTVDPDVLNISRAKGAGPGYFLWEFANASSYTPPSIISLLDAMAGFGDISGQIVPTPLGGAGEGYSGLKLITLEFTSKSETFYSLIDLINIEYLTPDNKWHPVDEVIDGEYNQPVYHNLTVGSTPIVGINFTIHTPTYTTNMSDTTNTSVILLEKIYTVSMPSVWMVGADQYNFTEWEDNSTNPVRTISLTSNMTITASYAKNYTLTVNSIPISGVNFTIDSSTYTTNASVILLEGPHTVSMPSVWMVGADQYNFTEWEDNSTNPVRAISLTSNMTITATYALVHVLTVESTPIDGINFTIDTTTYATNTSVILVVKNYTVSMPSVWMVGADQYNFTEWEDSSTNPVRVVSLTSNTTIIATYQRALNNYTLTVNSVPITGVNFTIGSTDYATNTSVILLEGNHTVTLPLTWMNGADKYIFRYWENNSTNRVRTISLLSNTTITATYELALAPVASFTFSPTEPIVDETVTFNASASADPDGTIVSYAWDFGDGDSGTGAIAEHAYEAAGDYNVTLTITDNDDLTHTITKTITVKEAPPSGIPLELYLIAAGVIGVIIIAIVVYYLKIMKQKPA